MYGIVNKGVRDMIIQNYGHATWQEIKNEAGCEDDFFMSMYAYEDEITYNLVGAASKILDTPAHDILVAFGEYWINFTADEGYGELLQLAGNTFPEFLSNLDNLHQRVGSTYKHLNPPSFLCKEINEHTLLLEYHSSREGLSSLVLGLIKGLGKKFNVSVEVKQIKNREEVGYDEFFVNYFPIEKEQSGSPNSEKKTTKNAKGRCPFSTLGGIQENISTDR